MNTKLKRKIYNAIKTTVESSQKKDDWQACIFPEVYEEMTEAACKVFDDSGNGEAYNKLHDARESFQFQKN